MISFEGEGKVGGRLSILLQPKDGEPFRFRPKVLEFSRKNGIRWIGRVGIGGLFDGEHSLKWASNGDGSTTFLQEETFKGLLVPLLRKRLELQTKPAFEEMNRALKARVEKR
ncbi:MAG: hypothetical protein A4E32_01427 [Methanomassiliicoccales archaeon PtaU1.Bin124]|nr:MAG: hypothetical protein A4E32_01427 [Methanomassiliicoccales archaeon PtaU1.Bin124]